MAFVAHEGWVIVNGVTKQTSNDEEKSPTYTGIVYNVGSGVSGMKAGDEVYFGDHGSIYSIYHSVLEEDLYFVPGELITAYDES